MKIVFFLPHMGAGGVERSTSILAHEMATRGHEVTVLGLGKNSQPHPHFAGLEYHHLSARHVSTGVLSIARYLRREKPDAVISSQSYANVATVIAAKLARFRGKIVLSERLHVSAATGSGNSLKTRLTRLLMRFTYGRADGIVAISQGVADDLVEITRLPPERFTVIHNPVNHPDVHEKAAESVDFAWLEDPAIRTIVTVARLERQKNVASLLQAFALVAHHQDNEDLRLLVIGDGSERSSLELLAGELGIKERVKFTGTVSNPYKYMARSHLFVLSSLYEGLGNVLIEALALQLPIVSTDCPSGPAEILQDGRFGLLVRPDDSEALADGMRSALEDYGSMKAKTKAAQASLDRFTPETAVTSYLALLSNGAD